MTIPQLLHSMCAELSDSDLNAIRKARGFSAAETSSRTSFASFYVTSTGVAEVMQVLSPEEVFALRLLHETGEVDVSFFERVYGTDNSRGTYTQRYKNIFDTVKKNLVRRGLVVMAEVKMRGDTVQLERWRFALPPEFVPHLPALSAVKSEMPGQTNDYIIRKKLLELIGGSPAVSNDPFPLALKHGSLYLKDYPFSIATFGIWQIEAWQRSLNAYRSGLPASLSPIEAALNLLSTESWMTPQSIEPALQIYCFSGARQTAIPSAEKLLRTGWELGLLERLEINNLLHYRLTPAPGSDAPQQPHPAALDWADTIAKPGAVKIDLRRIPLNELNMLNSLAHLVVEKEALFASPSLVKLGRSSPAQRNSPLSHWLAREVPAFGGALETVETRWGKTILHDNLLVARVRDLSLRIQLERELKDRLIVLNEHFIAFPVESRASVEKVLKKTGFVTRTVRA